MNNNMNNSMNNIRVNIKMPNGINETELFDDYGSQLELCHGMLHNKSGKGNEFLGWLDRPKMYDKDEFEQIKNAAGEIRSKADVLLVVGIGGSYLGARAVIEALNHNFYNSMDNNTKIYFIGHNMSSAYIADLFEIIKDKEIYVNVISKSGMTVEPAIAFRLVKRMMEERYGNNAASRIYVTTDKEKGALKRLAGENGYKCFVVPDDIGGRYSVLTPVGLLPIAVSGVDIDRLMAGALDGYEEYADTDFTDNRCYKYAVYRNFLYKEGKKIEILVNYEPNMMFLGEWWKQLFGESEGKERKGLFPASVNFTTDLHSLGQYIQEGEPHLFETVIDIEKTGKKLTVPEDENSSDGLDYLVGKELQYINRKAMEGTMEAHNKGLVPNIIISVPEMNEYYMGKLIYMFEKACGISGYMLGVNPFDQPGVEEYKINMFKLLGRPE